MANMISLNNERYALEKALAEVNNSIREVKDNLFSRVVQLRPHDESWKAFLTDNSVLPNICYILEDDYDLLNRKDDKSRIEYKIGKINSPHWHDFIIKVIERLLNENAFNLKGEWPEDFSDTANGCDEIVFDAAQSVIYGE